MSRIDRYHFERLVERAVANLPDEFQERLENVDVVVEDWPSPQLLRRMGLRSKYALLGLYQGVPLTERGGHYGLVPPDKISIFQGPIEAVCRRDADIVDQAGKVVRHEIAHHFGIDDARLKELEEDRGY
ncbi:MAG: metallopeptidase family protein [Dehalococcoidia bacterium]|jgi:predicted Zn-dependent protease with MMP-like domain